MAAKSPSLAFHKPMSRVGRLCNRAAAWEILCVAILVGGNDDGKANQLWAYHRVLVVVDGAGLVARAASDPAGEAMSYIRPEALRADMGFSLMIYWRAAARVPAATRSQRASSPHASRPTAWSLPVTMEHIFQFVPFRSFHPDEKRTSLTLLRDGKEETLAFRQDSSPIGRPRARKLLLRPRSSMSATELPPRIKATTTTGALTPKARLLLSCMVRRRNSSPLCGPTILPHAQGGQCSRSRSRRFSLSAHT